MNAAKPVSTEQFLSSIQSELDQAFANRPEYGAAGVLCHFHDGTLVRVEVTRSILKKVPGNKRTGEN